VQLKFRRRLLDLITAWKIDIEASSYRINGHKILTGGLRLIMFILGTCQAWKGAALPLTLDACRVAGWS